MGALFGRLKRSVIAVPGICNSCHDAYPRGIRTELGSSVWHRTNCYLNNRLEQDHRGITVFIILPISFLVLTHYPRRWRCLKDWRKFAGDIEIAALPG